MAPRPDVRYQIIHYCPDLARDERVNVGLLLADHKTNATVVRVVDSSKRLYNTFGMVCHRDDVDEALDKLRARARSGIVTESPYGLSLDYEPLSFTITHRIKGHYDDEALVSKADELFKQLVALEGLDRVEP